MRLLIAIAVYALISTAAAAQDGETRCYFEDWFGACRADGYCSAIAT